MMQNMEKQYGKRGKDVYFATENKLRSQGKFQSMLAQARKHHDLMAKA